MAPDQKDQQGSVNVARVIAGEIVLKVLSCRLRSSQSGERLLWGRTKKEGGCIMPTQVRNRM
jgi:hypothetical protein